jgi:hypothetical protein
MIAEAVRSLAAAWRIMRHETQAFDDLNLTIEGFWRSFAAVVPILPMVWIVSHSMDQAVAGDANLQGRTDGWGWAILQTLLDWAAWPIVSGMLVRFLKLEAGYVRFIVAYNWIAVILSALICFPYLLHLLGLLSFPLTSLAGLFVLGVSLYYSWYLARVALAINGGVAATFAVADFALSSGIDQLVGQ